MAATNKINGRVYIGSTQSNEYVRWAEHLKLLKYNKSKNKNLQEDWNVQDRDDFDFSVVQRCSSKNEMLLLEKQLIETTVNPYNIRHAQKSSKEEVHQTNARFSEKSFREGGLTLEAIRDIRYLRSITPKMTMMEIGNKYGVTHCTISKVLSKKMYAWVE